ncbi:hypothetical protein CHS0354_022931 [Potamilus streckersoni]|nr:hypothetical protein CHS0354_022931 [Potamilus streckersoni]
MNTRRGKLRLSDQFDSQPDVRFFSELVKPLQYKWRLQQQKETGKIVTPSKHGFHPRSQSPTFRRLVEATEKLQIIVEDDSGMGSVEKIEDDEAEIQSCFSLEKEPFDETLKLPPLRLTKSETVYSIGSNEPCKTFTDQSNINELVVPKVEPNQENVEPEIPAPMITKVAPINIRRVNNTSFDSDEETTPPLQQTSKIREFKVDFKHVDSHAELHLFLPHIEGMSRVETPDVTIVNRTGKIAFPAIENTNQNKAETKITPLISKKLKRSRNEPKKKVKSKVRVNSGKGDKVTKDVLNDVSTLISIENEKSHVHNEICPFENCAYHSHLVQT